MDPNALSSADDDQAMVEAMSRWPSTSTDQSAASNSDFDVLNFWDCGTALDQVYTTHDTVNSFDLNDANLFFGPFDICNGVQYPIGRVEELEDGDNLLQREDTPLQQSFNTASQPSSRYIEPQTTTLSPWDIAGVMTGDPTSLKYRIEAAMCTGDGGRLFLPDDALKSILSQGPIKVELQKFEQYARMPEHQLSLVQNDVLASYRRIFATLVMLNRANNIAAFRDEKISDSALPLVKIPSRTTENGPGSDLRRHNATNVELKCFGTWSQAEIDGFDEAQWKVLAPVFSDIARKQVDFLDLDDKAILPFSESSEDKKHDHYKGGYSEVFRVKIHHAHHDFQTLKSGFSQETFAVKKLMSTDEASFRREVEVLQRLHNADHPNVVSLLATYKYRGYYHLIFPWADGDLRRLWQSNPNPDTGREEARWLASQCAGIASALNHVHNGADSWLNGAEPPDQLVNAGRFYGMHGDIKPENIFVFSRGQKTLPALNMKVPLKPSHGSLADDLVIGDFGGGLFYDPAGSPDPLRQITTTYRPPEYDTRRKPVTRSFDIWGLGCTYLEFLTWFLKGSAGLSEFAKHRTTLTAAGKLSDEYFETFEGQNGSVSALLKGPVLNWINGLRSHKNASNFIREFLDFITHRMFIVETESINRASCEEVSMTLDQLTKKCFSDDRYCVPSPSSSSGSPSDAESIESTSMSSLSATTDTTDFLDFGTIDVPVNFSFETPESFDFDIGKWNTAPTNLGDSSTLSLWDDFGVSQPFASPNHTMPAMMCDNSSARHKPAERKRKRSLAGDIDEPSPVRRVSPETASPAISSSATRSSHHTPDPPAPAKDKRFACPYYKNNPTKFRHKRTCCGPGWPTVHRVKEHLYRCHTIGKHTCSRCLLRCKSAAELLAHQRAAAPCEALVGADAFPEGTMMPCQEEALRVKRRVPATTTEEWKWGEAYGVLFPESQGDGGAELPSPFYEDGAGGVVAPGAAADPLVAVSGAAGSGAAEPASGGRGVTSEYERYLGGGSLPPDIQRDLEEEVRREFGFVGDAAQTSKVVDMVRRLQLRLFQRYEESRRVQAG